MAIERISKIKSHRIFRGFVWPREIPISVLKTVKISLPDSNVVGQFSKSVEPIFKRLDLLEQENQHLTQLRDLLLPMLMNGQVTVNQIQGTSA